MNINSEISRLLDVMPASGRMLTKIVSKSTQSEVIRIPFAFPWNRSKRLIYINFDLWYQLTEAQRDLLILRVGFHLQDVYSFKLNLNQFILSLGVLELFIKVLQRDTLGISIFGILIIIFTKQFWYGNQNIQKELDFDKDTIKASLKRGYRKDDAAKHLLEGIKKIAKLESHPKLESKIRLEYLQSFIN